MQAKRAASHRRAKAHSRSEAQASWPVGERRPIAAAKRRRAGRFLLALAVLLSSCADKAETITTSALEDVDPFIGSGGLGFSVGSIQPGPALPFGMAKPGPDTSTLGGAPGFSHCAGYWFEDDEVRGFSQIHLIGTGVPDQSVLMIMPLLAAETPLTEDVWRAGLDHRLEQASAGYYRVRLLPSGIDVEISATEHTSVYRIGYPSEPKHLAIDLAHGVLPGRTTDAELRTSASPRELAGWLHHEGAMSDSYGGFTLYFVMRADRDFETSALDAGREVEGPAVRSARAGALLRFSGEGPVRIQIGLSYVDEETARKNLEAEWVEFDLDRARGAAQEAWARRLGAIEIEGGTPALRRTFHTALYHAHMMPTRMTESGGLYRGVDGEVHRADHDYYSDFSLWDTFRTLHPLLALIAPELQTDMNRSLVRMLEETGRIPKWPLATGETNVMIGYHGETVLADSFLKGVSGFDAPSVYEALRAAALGEGGEGTRKRDCFERYVELGFCPADEERGAVSKTLENAFSDFVLARLARALGREDDAGRFEARARGWSKLADPETGMIRGKNADGRFVDPFRDDLFSEDFVEGNARQWTPFVPHDVRGLAEALGGEARLLELLETLFESAAREEDTPFPDLWYWHGNEPDLHAAYMFAELGRPDLTHRWVDWVRRRRYSDTPQGLDGNDDGGTLSAWFVFSALGLYPKVGEARYVLGTPAFPRAVLHLGGGKEVVIVAEGATESAIYVREVEWNGERLPEPFLSHEAVVQGGELRFFMSEVP